MSEKIKLNHITKVEGHASLEIEIDKGLLTKCNLQAIEGARFFEGIVVGKHFNDVKEITSRICGICSVAHSMASLHAVENALNVQVSQQTKLLRELMTIGERIRSHATHLYFLSLPDFLGYESALQMAPKYQEEVENALALMKIGNIIVEKVGGRQMHPVSSVVGGFTHVPSNTDRKMLQEELKKYRLAAINTLKIFLELNYPDIQQKIEHMSLEQDNTFPLLTGDVISDNGFRMHPSEYKKFLTEYLTPYATSKFAIKEGKEYMTGALARVNTNYFKLSKDVRAMLDGSTISFPSKNPFHNLVAQAIELVHWLDRGIDILDNEFTFEGLPKIGNKAGLGISATEAPRGILYHEYDIDENGIIKSCNIITPTVQNLANMELDIKTYVQQMLDKKKKQNHIVMEIEKLIRAYDPCFSCSTHFLQVDWKEE